LCGTTASHDGQTTPELTTGTRCGEAGMVADTSAAAPFVIFRMGSFGGIVPEKHE
jgi:hypothetical protein